MERPVTLISQLHGGIETILSKHRTDTGGRYLIQVRDEEGLLYAVEFPWSSPAGLLTASEEALEYVEQVVAVVEQYVDRPTAMNIRALIDTMH